MGKRKRLAVWLIFLLLMGVACTKLEIGMSNWGDDFAGYMNEGIAIANGNFKEQVKLNYYLHPTEIPAAAKQSKELVYVWGYPLVLSAIYKLAGFNIENYNSIIYYKLPTVFFYALLGIVLFLFYRTRFSDNVSALAAILFCQSSSLTVEVNRLGTDILFLLLSVTAFVVSGYYSRKIEKTRSDVPLALFYALILLYSYETRLNGYTVCITCLLGHVLYVLRYAKRERGGLSFKSACIHFSPYLLCIMLVLFFESAIFAPATRNTEDIGNITLQGIIGNLEYYRLLIADYYDSIFNLKRHILGSAVLYLAAVGAIFGARAKDDFALSLFVVGTLIVVSLLPYTQGTRYIFNILPIIFLFGLKGIGYILRLLGRCWNAIKKKRCGYGDVPKVQTRTNSKAGKAILYCCCIGILLVAFYHQGIDSIKNLKDWGHKGDNDVYAPQAIELYDFIKDNIPEDAAIGFMKPRALYLNTHRMAFRINDSNKYHVDEVDYLVYSLLNKSANMFEIAEDDDNWKRVFENECFIVYKGVE